MKKILDNHQLLAGLMTSILESPMQHRVRAVINHQIQHSQHHHLHRQMKFVPLSNQGPAANQHWRMLSTTTEVLGMRLPAMNELLSLYPALKMSRHRATFGIPQSPLSSKVKLMTPLLEAAFRQCLVWKTIRHHIYSSRLQMLKRDGDSYIQCYLERRKFSSTYGGSSVTKS